ncbi:rab11 family-interacting protein 4 isoform X1 [Canis lupus baileyi]|uniref:Rab11 family-interacting protein 4 n=3 Tax=Canidae TaxID=9608 RepID=A0A8C0YZ97_CANLF|nr:rab11 family-interacting protein 4 isoform X1 [Canis lupus dingo]XP_038404117.1 rab11 family-interacting protein 4 isoform X1 [Canis lupus familiaris]XP_038466070.1 rab11 family-interacting protein 4 isoform X1 [Canis lupus familiaris]XP_038533335.1 rab11 family-interacting protein 4 isoform X1 [Canis lupus familiaris]
MAGGAGWAGAPAALLRSVRRLREVFEVCGRDPDGFLRVERVAALGLRFGQGEEVEKLVKYLDPNDLGRINFKDFCRGVFAMKGCEELLKDVLSVESAGTLPCTPEIPDCVEQGSEVPGLTFADGELLPRGPGFFPEDEEEAMTLAPAEGPPESDTDSPMESTQSLEGSLAEEKDGGLGGLFLPEDKSLGHAPSMTTSDLSTHSTTSLISNEEQFEDYGEGDDVDCAPSSPCPDDETRTNVYSDLGSSVSSSAGQTPRKMRHTYNSELLDVYCSQCCKKINLLNDLEARLKNLKANSPNRKISSTAFGRQLMHSSNFSSSDGSTEDLFRDSIDSCDNDITEKVSFLEKKVTELENDSLTNGDLKSKLKQENTQLVHRVHELEEMVKDQETMAEQALEEEARRHREAYSKLEREKSTEIELLNTRVQQLEEENVELRTTVTRLKAQTEKLDEERQRMSDRLEDTSLRLKDETDLYKRVMDKLRQNRLEFQKEREATQELIEDLRKELEHLQMFKLDCERPGRGRSSSSGLGEFNTRAREVELEHEVKRLKQENHKLRDQNDDLNGQILSLSLYEAKNLFATQTKAQSLAAEIDTASRDELMEALKEQEEINFRLRQYMDKIILAILDHNPSILEIKH